MKLLRAGVVAPGLIGVLAGLGAPPAQATWHGTRWGMSVEDVLATVGDSAREVRDERDKRIMGARRLVTSEDTREELHYTVDYLFTSRERTLTKVNLIPEVAECGMARAAFAATLGDGEASENRIEIAPGRPAIVETQQVWQDPAGQGTVSYLAVSFEADVQYCQILFQE